MVLAAVNFGKARWQRLSLEVEEYFDRSKPKGGRAPYLASGGLR